MLAKESVLSVEPIGVESATTLASPSDHHDATVTPRVKRFSVPESVWRLLVPLLLVVVWQTIASLGIVNDFVLPSPTAVLQAYVELWQAGDLQAALHISLWRAGLGFLIGGGAGLLLGLAAGLSRRAERGYDALLQMLRTIPFIALVPIFVVWFGIGETSKIALIVGASVTPMYLSVYHAIRGIDGKLAELGRAFHLSRRHYIRLIVLPMALPGILVGARYAAAAALLALVAAEQINASAGIGFILNNANQFQRTDIILAGILIYAVLGILVDTALRQIENRVLSWR